MGTTCLGVSGSAALTGCSRSRHSPARLARPSNVRKCCLNRPTREAGLGPLDRQGGQAPARRAAAQRRQLRSAAAGGDGTQPASQTRSNARAFPGQLELQPGALLGGKYEVVDLLGRGGNAVTYLCRNTDTGTEVAVKCLSLRSLKDWKQLELFEREAQILKNLEHKGIPRYLEYFEQDAEEDRTFFLVQEVVPGRSLADMVASGWRADEAEVSRIATELLGILEYLGSRRPAVTHRDVKPENVVIEGGKSGGRVFLVDFGGVQAAAAAGDSLGSTIVGTYGYMAPEQFRGAATPASDLYGLGATLLYLLSGRPPSAFPVDRMRIDFGSVKMGARLEAVVDGLLEPLPEDRLPAQDALAILSGQPRPARTASGSGYGGEDVRVNARRPAGSKIEVKKRGPRLEIDIPPSGFSGANMATGAFAIAWNSFVAFWTISAVAGGGLLFGLFSLPFWAAGIQLAKQALGRQFIRERLVINLNSWKIEQQVAFARRGGADWDDSKAQRKEVSGRAADLSGASLEVPLIVNGQPQYQLVLEEGINRHVLGEGLNPLEQEWLAEVINAHLEENRGRTIEISGSTSSRRALPQSAGPGPRFADFAGGAQREAQRAEAAARTAGQRALQEAARSAEAARRQAQRAQQEAQRSGRLGGSAWGRRQQRRSDDDDDDDLFNYPW